MQATIDNVSKYNSQFGIESSIGGMKESLQYRSINNTPIVPDRMNFTLAAGEELKGKTGPQEGIFASSRNPAVDSLNNRIYQDLSLTIDSRTPWGPV